MVEMEVLTARIGAREAENEKEKAICCLTCVFIIVSLPLTKVGEWGSGETANLGEENGCVSVNSIINYFWCWTVWAIT